MRVEKNGVVLTSGLAGGTSRAPLLDTYGPGIVSNGDIEFHASWASTTLCNVNVQWQGFDSAADVERLASGSLLGISSNGDWDEVDVPANHRVAWLRWTSGGGSCFVRITSGADVLYHGEYEEDTIDLGYGIAGPDLKIGISNCSGKELFWTAISD